MLKMILSTTSEKSKLFGFEVLITRIQKKSQSCRIIKNVYKLDFITVVFSAADMLHGMGRSNANNNVVFSK